jgi:hypothetical protein
MTTTPMLANGTGTVLSGTLDEFCRRLVAGASGGAFGVLQKHLETVEAQAIRDAPVKTGTYKRSIKLAIRVDSQGVSARLAAVEYARFIRSTAFVGPTFPAAPAPKPNVRWQSDIRKPALFQMLIVTREMGAAILGAARGR